MAAYERAPVNVQLIVLFLVIAVTGAFLYLELRRRNASRRALTQFWSRPCTGKSWLRAFPTASAHDIRRFLHLFVDAFAFPRRRALKFSPGDQLMRVYRIL